MGLKKSLIGQNGSKLVHMDQNESNHLLFVKMGKPPWKSVYYITGRAICNRFDVAEP